MVDTWDDDFHMFVLLRIVVDTVKRAREKELAQYGLTTRQAAIITVIQFIGHHATPAEISRWEGRRPNSISIMLETLQRKGLIDKSMDLDKKNLVRVALTAKGLEAYNEIIKGESIHEVMSTMSKEQRGQIETCLEILLDKALKMLGIKEKPNILSVRAKS